MQVAWQELLSLAKEPLERAIALPPTFKDKN